VVALLATVAPNAWGQPTSEPSATGGEHDPPEADPGQPESEPTGEEPIPDWTPFDHSDWDALLDTYVSADGGVDYAALAASEADLARLERYLEHLAGANTFRMPEPERLAFWINAYNACTVYHVLGHYPLESVYQVPGFFDQETCTLAGSELDLNEIENEQIRDVFNEPRIHFALVPAARGGPPLRAESYDGHRIDEQLEAQATDFVRATTHLRSNEMEVELNRLFEWFGRDFGGLDAVREFVAQRLEDPHDAEAVRRPIFFLTFSEFDWRLNEPAADRTNGR
jgi:hypothetical protein